MAIPVTCGRCGQRFQTRDENAGRQASCPDCGNGLEVPGPRSPRGAGVNGSEPATAVTSEKAVISVLLGVCSFLCMFFTGIPAIVFGYLGLNEINRSHGRVKGKGLALLGLGLGVSGSFLVSTTFMLFVGLPLMVSFRDSAHQAQCTSNLTEIGLAMHNYLNERHRFPAAAITDRQGRPLLSWRVAILPYLGPKQASLYHKFHLNEPWDSPNNAPLVREMPEVYACPSEPKTGPSGQTIYQVIVGRRTMFTGGKGVKVEEVTDGTSNTILLGEAAKAVTWTAPDDPLYNVNLFLFGLGSRHPGGFNAVFADGSARFLTPAPQSTYSGLLSRDGSELVSPPY